MKINFNNSLEEYPIVLIPKKILENINQGINESLVKKNFRLIKPEKPYSYPPIKPQRIKTVYYDKYNFFDLGCLIHTIIGCLAMSLLFVILGLASFFDSFLIIFVILGSFSIITKGLLQGNPLLPKSSQGKREVKISEEEYEESIKRYEEERIIYSTRKLAKEEKYREDLKNYESTYTEEKYKIAHKLHLEDLTPRKAAQRSFTSSKRGANEIDFLKILNESLREYTFIDKAISINSFCPDIVLVSPKTNLHIDLEIDEPYTLNNKSPIHYKGCKDSERNEYFLSHNWCVIRFSERQIVEQPKQCCQTIISIINSLENMIPYFETKIRKEKRWSYEDAIIMADSNYRSSYK